MLWLILTAITLLNVPFLYGGSSEILSIARQVAGPLEKLENMSTSDAIDKMHNVFLQLENLLSLYINYEPQNELIGSGCQLYVIHSLVTKQFFKIAKLAVQKILLPYLRGTVMNITRFVMVEYLDLLFSTVPSHFMRNIAINVSPPFFNAFYSIAVSTIKNLSIPVKCRDSITHLVSDFSGWLLIISDENIAMNIRDEVFRGRIGRNYKKIAISRILGHFLLHQMGRREKRYQHIEFFLSSRSSFIGNIQTDNISPVFCGRRYSQSIFMNCFT